MIAQYHDAQTPLHRIRPGPKLAAVFVGASIVFIFPFWSVLGLGAFLVGGLYVLAGIPARLALAQIRPVLLIFLAIYALHAFMGEWIFGLFVLARLALVIMLAALVTLTTRVSEMVEALEAGLSPLRHVGVDPARVALAVAMTIRFIPVIAGLAASIREAQAARGLDRSFIAVLVPLIVRTLRMADGVAEALDARGFETRSAARSRNSQAIAARGGEAGASAASRD
jgi:biotin transport system permease protein